MDDKFQNKYRITPARLKGWDYGAHGLYFVTICLKDRVRYFGEISDSDIPYLIETEIGKVAYGYWLQIPQHFPFVQLDEFIIMPDHLHGILFINKPKKEDWTPNRPGKQSQNLASIIRAYKSSVKRYANMNGLDLIWQNGYYDRVVRNEQEYQSIREYIYRNPENWLLHHEIDDSAFFIKPQK